MTSTIRPEFVTEACIEEILAGRWTVRECITAWFDTCEEIEPVLFAVEVMQATSPPADTDV